MILVTGATGFLGSELVKQLVEKGKPVRALKRSTSQIPAILAKLANIEWVIADMNDYFSLDDAFENITEVYHCAAFISFEPAHRKQMHQVNTGGTINIVNLCLDHGVRKLIHVSSIAAVGDAKPGQPITERDQWEFNNTQDGYAISKYESEMEVWRGIAEGLDAAIVNPSLIVGKNAGTAGTGQLFEKVRNGFKFYTMGSCGLVDVEDVAKSMIMLMESEISGERYILNGADLLYRDLFARTARLFNLPAPSIAVKKWMMNIAWRISSFVSIFTGSHVLTRFMAKHASSLQQHSSAKIIRDLDFEFKPIDQSISEICTALKQQQ